MLSKEFLLEFKLETEERWRNKPLDPGFYGFQFQAGTRWNPGLSDEQILAYENALGIQFPMNLKVLLDVMNGTDLPNMNIYPLSGS
jgi:hypothetical protein